MGDALRFAMGTLTALPTKHPRDVNDRIAATGMCLAPWAGVVLGLVVAAVMTVCLWLSVPHLTTGLLCVAALTLATRALHHDGLADTVDGLGASFDRDKALAVMRSGDVGPMGLMALILTSGAQVLGFAACSSLQEPGYAIGTAVAICLIAASRLCLPLVCAFFQPVRADGLGALVIGHLRPTHALAASTAWIACGGGLFYLAGPYLLPALGVTVGIGLVAGVATAWHVTRKLGGITGDTLGACVEISLATMAVTLTIVV